MTAELLFEIGCEEIPAEDLFILTEVLKAKTSESFEQHRLVYSNLETFATPRRLGVRADVEPMQSDLHEQRLGPPLKIAYGSDGRATPAGLGFAKNVGVPFEQLLKVETARGEYVAAEIVSKGKRTQDVLKEVLPDIIASLPFRKYMRWGAGDYQFGRPIRNVLLLYNGKVVPMEIAGVSSNRYTNGHLFLSRFKKIPVSSYEDYRKKLLENGVILFFADRLAKIAQELREHSAILGASLRDDPDLLRVMANEVEYPEVLTGRFSEDFLKLPQEILINAMRKHQKYFCAHDPGGKLLPVFFAVLNTKAYGSDLIRGGHQRVLQARLRDAEFFWHEDLKTSLADRTTMLSRLTYHEKLGSYADKIERMISISDKLLDQLERSDLKVKLEKLIRVSKVDLLTHMVGEFPEMQGVMAGLYARKEGYPEEEWRALYEQYAPVSADDPVPSNFLGAYLSLIDRIEVLATGYTLNMIPTGSRDPYALRRIATGAVKIVLEHELNLNLQPLFERALSLYSIKTKTDPAGLLSGLTELMEARFRFLMEQKDIAVDYLNAVLNVEKRSLLAAHGKLMALWSKKGSEDLKTLARGFKRINNIIFDQPKYEFDEELMQEDGEVRLARAFADLEFRVSQNISEEEYYDAVDIMVTLGPEIDNFFDEVLVMTDNEKLRNNRIALLQKISDLYHRIADFSALQIEL